MKRPLTTSLAAILTLVVNIYSIVFSIPVLARGFTATVEANDSPPYFIMVIAIILGVLGVVAAWGLWSNQRWGKILTIIVTSLNGLSALPGVMAAPTDRLRVEATVFVVISIVILVLVLWPTRQSVPTQA
jgi:uncharacterized membrane protein (DUF2068 family)